LRRTELLLVLVKGRFSFLCTFYTFWTMVTRISRVGKDAEGSGRVLFEGITVLVKQQFPN
jgi:hypothetical protein